MSHFTEEDLTPAANRKMIVIRTIHPSQSQEEFTVVYDDPDGFPETIGFYRPDFDSWKSLNCPNLTQEKQVEKYLIHRLNLHAVAEVERLKRVIANIKKEAEEALNKLNEN